MTNKYSKILTTVFAIFLLTILTLSLTFTFKGNTALADTNAISEQNVKPLTVGHITDIHYFPLEYCYKKVNEENYYKSDFYGSMTGDTKLVLESGLILAKTIQSIMKDADEGKAPLYFVVSGDLSKNGEHVALIDVANALRYLQNYVRSKSALYPDYKYFQIFVNQGNHDLYNGSAAIYDSSDGSSIKTDAVDAKTFALIFAGLGYPNASIDGSIGINLSNVYEENYWSSSYTGGYQQSSLSTSVKFQYYNNYLQKIYDGEVTEENYAKIEDSDNVLSYIASINAPGYEPYTIVVADATSKTNSDTTITRIFESEFETLVSKDSSYVNNHKFYSGDYSNIQSTLLTNKTDILNAFTSKQQVYVVSEWSHNTGGKLTEKLLDWIEDYTNNSINAKGAEIQEESYIIVFHMNLLPHWEQEDDILKDFVVYNYENTAKRLLNMGIHYSLTGHQHSSDIMAYTDALGRTIYDLQTNSSVSYDSQRRYITLSRYNCDNKLGESFTSQLFEIDNLKEIPSNNIFTAAAWNDVDFNSKYTEYKNALNVSDATTINTLWNELTAINPDYYTYTLRYDELSTLSYNEFSNKDIYSILLDRILNHFVSYEFLGEMIEGLYPSIENNEGAVKTVAGILGINNKTISNLLRYVVDVVFGNYEWNQLPSEYYLFKDGKYPDYNKNDVYYDNAFEYIKAIAYAILDMEYGNENIQSAINPTNKGKMTLSEMASFILIAHTSGIEVSLEDTAEEIYSTYVEQKYTDTNSAGEIYGFKNPLDATYRLRMVEALKDIKQQCESGKLANDLITRLLDPLYVNNNSLLKTLLSYKFDLSKAVEFGYITKQEHDNLDNKLTNLIDLFNNPKTRKTFYLIIGSLLSFELPEDFSLPEIDIDNLELLGLVNSLVDIVKPLLLNLLGFNLNGSDLYGIVDNLLNEYVTDSFYIGLSGIAKEIIISYGTDVYPDNTNNRDLTEITLLQPSKINAGNYSYGNTQLSYLNTLNKVSEVGAAFNAATKDNGRVPSHITSNFDTKESTTSYTFKFYTAEDVYGTFKFKSMDESNYHIVSTIKSKADIAYNNKPTDYKDILTSEQFGNINVKVFTQTKPQYIPLIDLGLLCITHGEIQDEEDNFYVYGDRDLPVKNSVIYWNVTTVTITGLNPNTIYCYDLCGNYEHDNNLYYFSAVEYAKTNGYDKDYYTFKTAANNSESDFEFLAIADLQGMIQDMYTESYKAVEALLNDNRTNSFDFILNAGDMADNGKNFYQWGDALNTYERLFANTSTFFTAGNHEKGTYAMSNYYNYSLPENEDINSIDGLYYSFDYANSHFIVLNTNDSDINGLGKNQYDWLKKDLENNNKKWTFILMHKSLYSCGSHTTDSEIIAMREQLIPLFAKNNVSMVFAGHDHTYTSTYLIDESFNVIDKTDLKGIQYTGDGVLYITLGTMGTKFYNYETNDQVSPKIDPDKSIQNTLDTQTFGKVIVSDNMIIYTSYTYNSETNSIEIIGESKLSDKKIISKEAAIAMIVVIPTVCISGIVVTLIILKKKGKIGGKVSK